MISLTKKFSFSCAHRIVNHPGKCKNLHGHDYFLTVEIVDEIGYLTKEYPIVKDFGEMKDFYGEWIENNWDHSIILWRDDRELLEFFLNFKADGLNHQRVYIMDYNVTAESLCHEFLRMFPLIHSVTIEEGRNSSVTIYNK